LISALVAFETKKIDAYVTAGKLTADQAAKIKADLKNRITAHVERVRGMGHDEMGKGHKGKGPKGMGPHGDRGPRP
jgi:hypothetical protein